MTRSKTGWLALVLAAGALASASAQVPPAGPVPWAEIGGLARAYVAQESPPGVLPFAAPQAALSASPRLVFFHYFPIWLLSLDNRPVSADAWSRSYRSLASGGGRFVTHGGFFRERPITPPPWPSPYWRMRNFAIDVLRAQRIGADGFLVDLPRVNQGRSWQMALTLCEVAAHVAPGFRIGFEPGMAALRAIAPGKLEAALLTLDRCSAAWHLADGRLVVAPFAADRRPPAFWRQVEADMSGRGVPIALIPVLLNPRRHAREFSSISAGMSYWNVDGESDFTDPHWLRLRQLVRSLTPIWMAPVKPQDVRPKKDLFEEADNTGMLRASWMGAIHDGAQDVQVITWNDFSEGTEVEPSSAVQFLYYDLSAYYIDWYKTGTPPPIRFDAIYYSSRDQIIKEGVAPAGQEPMRLRGGVPLRNDIEMIAFLTRPATLEITIGGQTYRQNAAGGMDIFTVPAAYGQPVFRILRGGHITLQVAAHYVIAPRPWRVNPLYWGGSSNRPVIEGTP